MNQEQFFNILSSKTTYVGAQQYIEEIQKKNMDVITICINVIVDILKNEKGPHNNKIFCLQFINELMMKQEYEWHKNVQSEILPILENFAFFKLESQDDNRGKYLFIQQLQSSKQYDKIRELEYLGNQFLHCVLESIWIWSKWFPLDQNGKLSLFKIAAERLAIFQVKFPILSFYSFSQVAELVQIQRPQKEQIDECREVIKGQKYEIIKPELIMIQSKLEKFYFDKNNNNILHLRTYPDLLKNAIEEMRKGKYGLEVQAKLKTARVSIMQKKLAISSKDLQKSKMILEKTTLNFTAVLNEKEKLLTDIHQHVIEKDQIYKQLNEKSQEIIQLKQQIEIQKQQIIQLKLDQQKNPIFNEKSDILESQINTSIKDMERLIQKKEIQIKRQEEQIHHYQSLSTQMYQNIDSLQQIKIQQDNQLFILQQQIIEKDLKIQEQQNIISFNNSQITKLNDVIQQLREQLQQKMEQHLKFIENNNLYIQQIESDKLDFMKENQQLSKQIDIIKKELEISNFDLNKLKNNYITGGSTLNKFNKSEVQASKNFHLNLNKNITQNNFFQNNQQRFSEEEYQ